MSTEEEIEERIQEAFKTGYEAAEKGISKEKLLEGEQA